MRRRDPRPIGKALAATTERLAPAGALPAVQRCWATAVGPVIAAESQPVSERAGVVTVSCRSAVWAHELELLSGDLLAKLADALGPSAVRGLRFTAAAARRRS